MGLNAIFLPGAKAPGSDYSSNDYCAVVISGAGPAVSLQTTEGGWVDGVIQQVDSSDTAAGLSVVHRGECYAKIKANTTVTMGTHLTLMVSDAGDGTLEPHDASATKYHVAIPLEGCTAESGVSARIKVMVISPTRDNAS